MMKSLRELTNEHAAIARIGARFERTIEGCERDGEMDAEAVHRLLAFFEEEVDLHHQEKEEEIFLPRVLACSSPEDTPIVREMCGQHREQRGYLAAMRNNLDGASFGEPNCIAVVARNARRYLALHREHSRWEQAAVFALAQRVLTESDDLVIADGFRRVDSLWGTSLCDVAQRLETWLDQRQSAVPT